MSKINIVGFYTQVNDLTQANTFHCEFHHQLLMSATGQELGSCGFLAFLVRL